MRKYLSTIHRQPPEHKKFVALFISSTITLFIFAVWSLVTFGQSGTNGGIMALNEFDSVASGGVVTEVSPFQSLRMSLGSSFEAIGSSFGELKSGLESINIEIEYGEMRDGALDTYGQ